MGRQAPANRTVYSTHVQYARASQPHTRISSLERALKWVRCGESVTVYVIRDGFALHRGSASVTPVVTERAAYVWNSKTAPVKASQLAQIAKWTGQDQAVKVEQYNGVNPRYWDAFDGVAVGNTAFGQSNTF